MSEPDWSPLTGFRVAVTSARRADELSTLLRRRGATVTSAAAIEMVPLPDDDELRVHTQAVIERVGDKNVCDLRVGKQLSLKTGVKLALSREAGTWHPIGGFGCG